MDEIEMNTIEETAAPAGAASEEMTASAPAENAEAEALQPEELSAAQKEVIELISRYPGLSPADIPEGVWQDFSQGRGGLAELYTRSVNAKLKADNEELRRRVAELEQAAENRRRSTDSRRSSGTAAGSLIDSIWYAD